MLKAVKFELSQAPQRYWDFVCKYGTLYQSRPYLEFYDSSGNRSFVIVVFDGDEIVGGSGITIMRRIFNLPITAQTYFGPAVSDKQVFTEVIKCIAELMKKTSLVFSILIHPDFVDLLDNDKEFLGWQKTPQTFLFWDISSSPESLWKQLPKGKKAAINRARREGVIIQEIETTEHLQQFQVVYEQSQIRGGRVPTLPIYFKNMIEIMKPEGLAAGFLALHPETRQPVAGVMLHLGWKDIARYYSVGQDYEYRNLGSTDFLMWHCLEYLKERGYTMFDLMGLPQGDSERAKGIRHFKTAWAGNNGHIRKTYTISYGNFGLNPGFLRKVFRVTKNIVQLPFKLFK